MFFKQVKQSLKLGSFLGHSDNVVRRQVYTALPVYVLLRHMAQLHAVVCSHAFGVAGADRSAGVVEILWDSIRAIHSDQSAQHRLAAGVRTYQKMIPLDGIVALSYASIQNPEKTCNRHSDEIFSRSCEITAQGSSCPAYGTAVRTNQKTVQKPCSPTFRLCRNSGGRVGRFRFGRGRAHRRVSG